MKVVVLLMMVACMATTVSAETPKTSDATDFVPLEIKRVYRNTYPLRLATEGNAAIVDVLTMIDHEGDMQHTKILNSTTPSFNDEAVRVVRQIWFEPAQYKGKKVSSRYQRRTWFIPVEKRLAVTPEFNEKYKALTSQLASGASYDDLMSGLNEIHALPNKTYYAIAQLGQLEAAISMKYEHPWQTIRALENAVIFEGKRSRAKYRFFEREKALSLWRNLFSLYVEFYQLKEARHAFAQFQGETEQAKLQVYQDKLDKLEKQISSDELLSMELSLSKYENDWFDLVRQEFAIFDLKGTISPFEFYCERKYKKLTIVPEQTYRIPKSWGNCRVVMQGQQNTKFVLVQQ